MLNLWYTSKSCCLQNEWWICCTLVHQQITLGNMSIYMTLDRRTRLGWLPLCLLYYHLSFDFYLWGILKNILCTMKPHSFVELCHEIEMVCVVISVATLKNYHKLYTQLIILNVWSWWFAAWALIVVASIICIVL